MEDSTVLVRLAMSSTMASSALVSALYNVCVIADVCLLATEAFSVTLNAVCCSQAKKEMMLVRPRAWSLLYKEVCKF